jgi:hypothetical protein
MAELLDIYQDNLIVIYNKITKLLNIFTNLNTEKFDLRSKDIEINLKEAERMLKQMDLELTTNNNVNSFNKNAFKKNYILYKNKYNILKKTFFQEKEKFNYTKKKEERILKEKIDRELEKFKTNSLDKSQIQKLIENEGMITKSNHKLQMVKVNAIQMENQSKNIMVDLENQTNQMENSHLKMQDFNKNLDSSNAIINKIFDKESRNKLVLATFSIVLLSVLFWILSSRI